VGEGGRGVLLREPIIKREVILFTRGTLGKSAEKEGFGRHNPKGSDEILLRNISVLRVSLLGGQETVKCG